MGNLHYQCNLSREGTITTAWIPERGARLGAAVEVPELGGYWTVVHVGVSQDLSTLKEREKINRKGLPSTRDTKKDRRNAS
jgi:hypothetical protein